MRIFFKICKVLLYIVAVLLALLGIAFDKTALIIALFSLLVAIWIKPDSLAASAKKDMERNKISSKQSINDWIVQSGPTKKDIVKQRIRENQSAGIACCPKCGSTSLSANKKGFGAGKAAAGMFLTGNLAGAVAGGIGANKVTVTCLNCGYKFKPGKK